MSLAMRGLLSVWLFGGNVACTGAWRDAGDPDWDAPDWLMADSV